MVEEEDDMPKLSGGALAALQEFYAERDVQSKRADELKGAVEQNKPLSMEMFSEDWNASQFWYSDETALTLAKELLEGATDEDSIVVISAPSAFIQLKNLMNSGDYQASPRLTLLEYDDRFSVLKEFVHYDFKSPFNLPGELKGQYTRVICDPPFLSDDCQTKAAMTAKWLLKGTTSDRIIVCTGERMESLIHKVYKGAKTTNFNVKHEKGLSNEFRCYANYEGKAWSWRP